MGTRMKGKRVLVTMADAYMGPAICELFEQEGAEVMPSNDPLADPAAATAVVAGAGGIDVLAANLAEPPHLESAEAVSDDEWHRLFDTLVHPLMRLTRAVLPQMIERRDGAIVAVTSAAPLKGLVRGSAYCAARGAQNAYIRSVGIEVARHNVRVNAIAQNYVENNVYYPPELLADAEMLDRMKAAVPAKRLAKGSETAELALFLASEGCRFMAGQIVPMAGGWATNT